MTAPLTIGFAHFSRCSFRVQLSLSQPIVNNCGFCAVSFVRVSLSLTCFDGSKFSCFANDWKRQFPSGTVNIKLDLIVVHELPQVRPYLYFSHEVAH